MNIAFFYAIIPISRESNAFCGGSRDTNQKEQKSSEKLVVEPHVLGLIASTYSLIHMPACIHKIHH